MQSGSEAIESLRVRDVIEFLLSDGLAHKPVWPPDAFAVAASLLKRSGAYVGIVNKWPPSQFPPPGATRKWRQHVSDVSSRWRNTCCAAPSRWPPEVETCWQLIVGAASVEMEEIHNNRPLVEALATMVAFADEACFGIGILPTEQTDALLVEGQYRLLSDSLCRDIHNSRAVVLPKLHNSKYGMTIRSLTHHLALWDKMEVLPRWKTAPLDLDVGLNVMLFPWPLAVKPRSFSVQKNTCGEHMPKSFGMFTYDLQTSEVDVDRVMSLLRRAETLVGRVDALIFPELSMTRPAFEALQQRVQQRLLIAGVGTEGTEARLGKNEVVVSWRDADSIDQSKHHRWRLDEYQIEQYGLGPSLAAKKWWWEAIDMRQRCCTFINVNEWFTFCALICEDLARQDPVAELVRSVGPNLVVALLMDGPQTPERWSARYATVLAEDPRSSVLTLTAAGLVDLARSQREGRPRSIALWKDAINPGARQILLEEGSEAVVLTLTSVMKKEWTADARHDMGSTGYLKLTATHQIGPAAGTEGSADVVISR